MAAEEPKFTIRLSKIKNNRVLDRVQMVVDVFYEPNVKVTKVWDDAGNQDGFRPSTITIKVLDGETVVDSQEIDGSMTGETWSFTSKDLPKKRNGELIQYTVEEEFTTTPANKYEMGTPEGNVTDGYTITNKHIPEETETTVKKIWDDAGNPDNSRPEVLVVTLNNGIANTDYQLKGNDWSKTVTGLPKYRNGELIQYTWSETVPDEYTQTDKTVENGVAVSGEAGESLEGVRAGSIRDVDHHVPVEISYRDVRCRVIDLHAIGGDGVHSGENDIGGEHSEAS